MIWRPSGNGRYPDRTSSASRPSTGFRFQSFVEDQVAGGRYAWASEVIREGLRLLEERKSKLRALRDALVAGEDSGSADYSLDSLISELDGEYG